MCDFSVNQLSVSYHSSFESFNIVIWLVCLRPSESSLSKAEEVSICSCNKRVVHKEETSRHCSKSPDYSQHCRVKREMKINIISPLLSVLRWPLWVCDGLRFSLDNATNPTRLALRFPEMPVFFRELMNKERKDSVVFISF